MSDVFISYKSDDRARVARLVQALEKNGVSVWWDSSLPGGEEWRTNIEKALDSARCVIVVWTHASVGPAGAFVRDEASRASARGILVPVRLDRVAPPLGFGELQVIDLAHWRGSARDAFLLDVVAAARAKLEGRAVPAAKGPMKRVVRRLATTTAAAALLAAVIGIGVDAFGLQTRLCLAPLFQPVVSDLCGALGLGGRPSRSERLAWDGREQGSCAALRLHIQQFPHGVYRTIAGDMLLARQQWVEDRWMTAQQPLGIYVGRNAPVSTNEQIAKGMALKRGRISAERECQDFVTIWKHRYKSAIAEVQEWNCSPLNEGVVCGFRGRAICTYEQRSPFDRESCESAVAR